MTPPSRVKPLPLPLVAQVCHYASLEASPRLRSRCSCLIVGFFFLLRPGEYLGAPLPRNFGAATFVFGLGIEPSTTSPAPNPIFWQRRLSP